MEGAAMTQAAGAERRPRRGRGSIKTEDIIDGAFELAEQVSIDNLSMPSLAKHLGVGVTSIYWYYRKKDDLLDAMTDRVWGKYDTITPFIDPYNWRESLANHARSMRKAFRKNAILTDLVLIRGALGPASRREGLRQMEMAIASLVHAGLTPEDAFDTYSALSVLVRGSVVMERLHQKTREAEGEEAHDRATLVNIESAPLIAKMMGEGHRLAVADTHNFEFMMTCILDHAEQAIALGARSAD